MYDLVKNVENAKIEGPLQKHILVAGREHVSDLGMEIYAESKYRPLGVEWLITSFQNQKISETEKFEVY